jgi:hypothetical protein
MLGLYEPVGDRPPPSLEAVKKKCEAELEKWSDAEPVKSIKNAMNLLKCPLPKLGCSTCCPKDWGGYYQSSSKNGDRPLIMICANNERDTYGYLNDISVIAHHEWVHAWQACDNFKVGNNPCELSVCKEIQAYYNTNCAKYADSDLREICVLRGVKISSKLHCGWTEKNTIPTMEKIDAAFKKLYKTCGVTYELN